MKQLISNSIGSTLMQVMVAGAVVAGVSVYMIRSNQVQNKLQSNVSNKVAQSAVARDFSETLMDSKVCFNTLKRAGTLSNNKELEGLFNKNDQKIYAKDSELYGQIISNIRLTDYASSGGRKFQKAAIVVTTSIKEGNVAVGGKSKTHKIPISLIAIDNVVDTCLSDETDSVKDALRRACIEMKGTFNEDAGECENIFGEDGVVLNHVKETFCASGKGANCVHPYAGQRCTGVDIRGQNHNNWVVQGFNGSAQMQCACVPRSCEDPSNYCEGTDLGTNWCQLECPQGTKTTDECAPPDDDKIAECEEWGGWAPSTGNVCTSDTLTQTRACVKGTSETESRVVAGTKDCPTVCSSWSGWTPAPDSICTDKTLTQTRSCTSGITETQSRTVSGTKTGASCCTRWGDWAPLANTVCTDKDLTQSRTCSEGVADRETRVVKGEKTDCNDCTIAHPAGWTANTSRGSCHCAEFRSSGPGSNSKLANGQSKELFGNYCQVYTNGDGVLLGNGSVTVTCVNGQTRFTNAFCEAGDVR